jgi:glycosyltransferase involved in cell wall biosynthesis
MANPRIALIGNYVNDDMQSMNKYLDVLQAAYSSNFDVCVLRPPALVGRLPLLPKECCKYLAYIDKLFIFPLLLVLKSHQFDLIHIIDQGNAFYAILFRRNKSIVTCHDMLAVRAAFGDASTACFASPLGIWLQRLILIGLHRAGSVVFVSQATRKDFLRFVRPALIQMHIVISSPLNAPFRPRPFAYSLSPEEEHALPSQPFLLMVGSSLPRKNRALGLQLLKYLGSTTEYLVVFAGAPFTAAEYNFKKNHVFGPRLLSIQRPSHALLNTLYCNAHALIFPSYSEGFGWPLLEAQACHCPVIASSSTSIPEVSGKGALYADPGDPLAFGCEE